MKQTKRNCWIEMPKCSTVFIPFVERRFKRWIRQCWGNTMNTMRQSMHLIQCLIPLGMKISSDEISLAHTIIFASKINRNSHSDERETIDFHFHVRGFVQIKPKISIAAKCSLLEITWVSLTNCGFAFTTGERQSRRTKDALMWYLKTPAKPKPHFYKGSEMCTRSCFRVCECVCMFYKNGCFILFVWPLMYMNKSHDKALLAIHTRTLSKLGMTCWCSLMFVLFGRETSSNFMHKMATKKNGVDSFICMNE